MEKETKVGAIPLDYIRGLIIAQGGRCAITGLPLDPQLVNADHIVPLSRTELSPSMEKDNIWLVHKSVNAMKDTLTYDELVEIARTIIKHHEKSKQLLEDIRKGNIRPAKKHVLDKWVSDNCSEDGKLKGA